MPFDFPAVSALLRCPDCGSSLVMDGDGLVCTDAECRRRYPVRDEIPCLLRDEAQPMTREPWAAVMTRNGRDPQNGR